MTREKKELQQFLKHLARFFPVIESLFNLERFVASVASTAARRVAAETPAEAERGRPDAALIRAKRWLWELFLNDLLTYPGDKVLARSRRLLDRIDQRPALPRYRGAGKYDPRLVVIEYDLLRELLTPLLKRQPGPSRRKIPTLTNGPLSGKSRKMLLEAETKKTRALWAKARRESADGVLSVSWWQEGQSFWFDELDLSVLTPHKAALAVLAGNAGRSLAAVWADIKKGRKALPQEALAAIETTWRNRRHAPEVCQVLGCCAPPA